MISIFTPIHDTTYLKDLAVTVLNQTYTDWQWLLLVNGDASAVEVRRIVGPDPRIAVVGTRKNMPYVGSLKREAASCCDGEILLEVDCDDLLSVHALMHLHAAAQENPNCGFFYSNCCRFRVTDANMVSAEKFGEGFGWEYYEENGFTIPRSFKAGPLSVSRIWFAPDHLRAWRKDIYWKVGGHNADMRVLDDQELMARTYLETEFHHIDKCLYFYRIHDKNTWLIHNKEIQDNVMRLYHENILQMGRAWSDRNNLLSLNLGCGKREISGLLGVDKSQDATIRCDLDRPWIWHDNSCGLLVAHDSIEHLRDPIHVMREAYRVLVHGGLFLIEVPSTDGRGAFQDPTHISFWNQNSFMYYTRAEQAAYIGLPVRFQAVSIQTYFPSEWHQELNIPYVRAHLAAIKDGPRLPGVIEI